MKRQDSNTVFYNVFRRLARKVRPGDLAHAETYLARDDLLRLLAGECYKLAQSFRRQGQEMLALKYMKLAARLLGLSLRPKKLSDLEEIKKAIAALKELRQEK